MSDHWNMPVVNARAERECSVLALHGTQYTLQDKSS